MEHNPCCKDKSFNKPASEQKIFVEVDSTRFNFFLMFPLFFFATIELSIGGALGTPVELKGG
jgi:hypothetical protein